MKKPLIAGGARFGGRVSRTKHAVNIALKR